METMSAEERSESARIAGRASAESLTPSQRKARSQKAVAARELKQKSPKPLRAPGVSRSSNSPQSLLSN